MNMLRRWYKYYFRRNDLIIQQVNLWKHLPELTGLFPVGRTVFSVQ
jgi:hypothetical protein